MLCYGISRGKRLQPVKRLVILMVWTLLATSCSGGSPNDAGQSGGSSPTTTLPSRIGHKGSFTDPLAGISFHYPVGWFVAGFSRTVSPKRLVVASYPVTGTQVEGDCGGMRALTTLPARGAAVLLIDYGPTTRPTSRFPPPPRHFLLRHGTYANYECFGRSYLFRFRAAGHDLQAHIAVGQLAAPARRNEALAILDSLVRAPR